MARNPNAPKVDFAEVDASTLPRNIKRAYDELKAANQVARGKRDTMTALLSKLLADTNQVPAGKEPVISYQFGKLAVGFVNAGEATKRQPKEKKTISFG